MYCLDHLLCVTGVCIQDGEIYPATFENKGPDEIIRHARVFVGDERVK